MLPCLRKTLDLIKNKFPWKSCFFIWNLILNCNSHFLLSTSIALNCPTLIKIRDFREKTIEKESCFNSATNFTFSYRLLSSRRNLFEIELFSVNGSSYCGFVIYLEILVWWSQILKLYFNFWLGFRTKNKTINNQRNIRRTEVVFMKITLFKLNNLRSFECTHPHTPTHSHILSHSLTQTLSPTQTHTHTRASGGKTQFRENHFHSSLSSNSLVTQRWI